MFLTNDDLAPFATIDSVKAAAMITDAEAAACIAAPCLTDLNTAPEGETEEEAAARQVRIAAVKAILRQAVLRYHERGAGAVTQTSIGGVSQTFSTAGSVLWNRDIDQLREICSTAATGMAFSIDTVSSSAVHADVCSINFGASYCSCGADIAGVPIYGVDC